jgi:CheY-like chemotaxis protein
MGNAANRIRKWRRGLKELSAARQESEPYGLIVTDMHMPKMDGFELVERIRQRHELSTAVIMMLTLAGHRGDAERCKELGVSAYLMKPIRQTELREAIARILAPGSKKARFLWSRGSRCTMRATQRRSCVFWSLRIIRSIRG